MLLNNCRIVPPIFHTHFSESELNVHVRYVVARPSVCLL